MTRVAKYGDVKFVVGGSASSSSSAVTTSAIDTNGFGVLTLGLAKSAGTIAVTCQSSNDNSTFASDSNILGATSMASTDTNGAVSYIGDKRYVKFVITPASATFSYGVVLSEKRIAD